MKPDFTGWATKNNLKCSDGRVIVKDAFKDNDGQKVPLVWNHQHGEIFNILGHAMLTNKEEGVFAEGFFNNTEQGQNAKMILEHGDIVALSIFANQLKQQGSDVVHGNIREVSLVLAPANPGASIDSVSLSHGEYTPEEGIIYTGEPVLYHSDDKKDEDKTEKKDSEGTSKEDTKEEDEKDKDDPEEIYNSMNDKQKHLTDALVTEALKVGEKDKDNKKEESEGGDDAMKHNVFDRTDRNQTTVLAHADQADILKMAKEPGSSLQQALKIYADKNDLTLQHDAVSSGFVQEGTGNVTTLFPEYQEVRPGAPELITNDQGWIGTVLGKVHKSPISRIRTSQVDIRNIDDLRAKGYVKGNSKSQTGNFSLVRRETDPQTVYVKSALFRDDVVDITGFDYVQYLYNIDRMQLNEELATAIMIGDGRDDGADGKISPEHIRPIWTDDDLYTIHVDIDLDAAEEELQGTNTGANFGENYITAEAMVNTILYARETYKGSGTPDLYITPHMLNVMLLARDLNGRRIYSSKAELASSLNVGEIYTAEQFANKTRTVSTDNGNKTKKLIGIVCNLADYYLGSTKGGEITHFTDFDIDFNQLKSLLETRVSGALTRVYSAIAIEEEVNP